MIQAAVNMKQKFGSTLDTREAAMTLFAELRATTNERQKIIFDFEGVEFISRSFADQFHKERVKLLTEQGIECTIKDAAQNVLDMLQVVSKTQQPPRHGFVNYPVFTFTNMDKLGEYLQGI